MSDRWSYPIPMTMQRHTGSAPRPRELMRPVTAMPHTAAPETTPADTETAPILQPPKLS